MHTKVVQHWWNSRQGMARKTIHIWVDPQTHTFKLGLTMGREEGGKHWSRVYVTREEALGEAQKVLDRNPDENWRDITRSHEPGPMSGLQRRYP